MAVSGVDPNGIAPPRRAPDSSTMNMDSFMKLLATQMQNQDMNNPMSNSEMMGQLTSMATVQSMNTFSELSSTQYAINLMGKEVTVAEVNAETHKMETKEGVVVGINLSDMTFFLKDNPKGYGLGNVMQVGKVPKKPDEDDDGTKPDPDPPDPPKPDHPIETPDPPNPDGPETKPDPPNPDPPNPDPPKPDGPGDEKNSQAAASSRSRAAGSGSITTLPDGRASVPVGTAAQDGSRTAQSGREAADGRAAGPGGTVNMTAADGKKEAWSLAAAKAAALTDQTAADKAAALARQTAGAKQAASEKIAQTDKADAYAEQAYKNMPRDKARALAEQAAGTMAADKAAALAEQAARTIPADKAAALERYRQTRGAAVNIGPGYYT